MVEMVKTGSGNGKFWELDLKGLIRAKEREENFSSLSYSYILLSKALYFPLLEIAISFTFAVSSFFIQ